MAAITFSQEESDKFFQAAIEELVADRENFKFSGNVAKVGEWAVQVDESFTQILYGLKQLDDKHGTDFPALGPYFNEWHGYKKQLDAHLHLSRDVASRHALDLRSSFRVLFTTSRC
ncbi:reovirus sigma C capsid domain protein, putative [Rhizoctonia solani AG-3 Rhs1AP]|uniref:Reovirus sigma C capsid domain protein, putative n=2 Tax=Rhizoctonia solani AG-3 TaxID=1086053 RepID=A0A0A1ULJ1_9AGAM|nr:reovirus sigma C capsid domain protein, putative [Rhizoctonia solani AG-3 Rhs1AP]KEP46838.1 putative reovirus sigma C capsid domain protein [Rhizoctonia solani 123E]